MSKNKQNSVIYYQSKDKKKHSQTLRQKNAEHTKSYLKDQKTIICSIKQSISWKVFYDWALTFNLTICVFHHSHLISVTVLKMSVLHDENVNQGPRHNTTVPEKVHNKHVHTQMQYKETHIWMHLNICNWYVYNRHQTRVLFYCLCTCKVIYISEH